MVSRIKAKGEGKEKNEIFPEGSVTECISQLLCVTNNDSISVAHSNRYLLCSWVYKLPGEALLRMDPRLKGQQFPQSSSHSHGRSTGSKWKTARPLKALACKWYPVTPAPILLAKVSRLTGRDKHDVKQWGRAFAHVEARVRVDCREGAKHCGL